MVANYEADENTCLSLNDISKRYKNEEGDKNNMTLGKYIQYSFPKAKASKVVCTYEKIIKYTGINERSFHVQETFDDVRYLVQWVPKPYFVCRDETECVQMASLAKWLTGMPL